MPFAELIIATLRRMIRDPIELLSYSWHSQPDSGFSTGPVHRDSRAMLHCRSMTGYRVSIRGKRYTLTRCGRDACLSSIRRVRCQGRGKTRRRATFRRQSSYLRNGVVRDDNIGHARSFPINNFDSIASQPPPPPHDDDLCKLQPVLNVLRSPTLADSSETFRNNSAPRARSCVPRPGSFLPFCAEPPRNNRFRRVTLANEARAIAFSPTGALLRRLLRLWARKGRSRYGSRTP